MKSIKFLIFFTLFATGTLFCMEEPEEASSNLVAVQDEFWAAIEENDPEKVKNALENGADPNEYKIPTDESHPYRPLSKAIDNFYKTGSDKSLGIVRYLLENGADPQEVIIIQNILGVAEPALFYVIRYSEIKNSDLQDQYQIYPLVKLLYTFEANPYRRIIFTDKKSYTDNIKNIFKLYFLYALRIYDELVKESKEKAALFKEDWAKIALLIYPEIIESNDFEFEREYLEKIKCKFLKDNPSEYFKKRYGSTFNYIRQRQYGIPPRKNRTFSKTNDSNNNSKEEQTACAQKRKFPDYI